jgi:hypothetical protein
LAFEGLSTIEVIRKFTINRAYIYRCLLLF